MEQVLKCTESGRVTKFYAVPTVYVRLLTVNDLKEKLGDSGTAFSCGIHAHGNRQRVESEVGSDYLRIIRNDRSDACHLQSLLSSKACGRLSGHRCTEWRSRSGIKQGINWNRGEKGRYVSGDAMS